MFYKEYLLNIMKQLKVDSNKKIENINKLLKETKDELIVQIENNDENAMKHWENQKKQIEELTQHYNMLVNAFNEQREAIGKLIKIVNEKVLKNTIKTTKTKRK